ncbi:MAG TPA: CPBP family intramembrane glutamic endopeptidase [Methylomirabilota bacterium]|nr:CPBP family intramembrane glutamic endopeptidase [Methylomirabilota bacterium]
MCGRCLQRIPKGKEVELLQEERVMEAGRAQVGASAFVHLDPADCKQARIFWLVLFGAIFFLAVWGERTGSAIVNLPVGIRATVDYVVVYTFGLVASAALIRYVWKSSPWDTVVWTSIRWKGILSGFAVTLTATFLAAAAVENVVLILLGTPIYSPAVWQSLSWNRVTISDPSWVGTIVVAAAEELIFRGLLFNYLLYGNSRWRVARATLISSVIFAFAHNLREPLSWFTMDKAPLLLGLTLLGVLLATAYINTGSLACAAGIHTGLGWIGLLNGRTHLDGLLRGSWLMGAAKDLRTAPVVWALFIALMIGCRLAGRRLRRLTE